MITRNLSSQTRISCPTHCSFFLSFIILLCFRPAGADVARQLLRPSILDAKSYTEVYTLTTQYDDQTFIQVQMSVTNLGVGNKTAACKVIVLRTAEKPWMMNERFNHKGWKYSDAPDPTLSIGRSTIVLLRDKILCSAILDRMQVIITLDGTPAPMKAPNTDFPKGPSGEFYEYEILAPWSTVETTLSLPGVPQKKFRGYGMFEHSRSVGTLMDVCRGWVTFRGFHGDSYFLANFSLPLQEKSPAAGWIWREGKQKPFAISGLEIGRENSMIDGKQKESQVISAADRSFKIIGQDMLYRYSFVDELGAFMAYLVKVVVGKPTTRLYKAQVQLSGGQPAMEGVLEIMKIE